MYIKIKKLQEKVPSKVKNTGREKDGDFEPDGQKDDMKTSVCKLRSKWFSTSDMHFLVWINEYFLFIYFISTKIKVPPAFETNF